MILLNYRLSLAKERAYSLNAIRISPLSTSLPLECITQAIIPYLLGLIEALPLVVLCTDPAVFNGRLARR